jgi:dolichol-phosphate mannosyltransferase
VNPLGSLVIVPTYNERANLPSLVPAILGVDPGLDVLIVDDNSPDGTGDLADELAAQDDRVKVLHRARKLGLGTAYVAGFRYALRHNYDRVVEMDGDFSHRPEDLASLLAAAEDADVVIGSRNISGGRTVGWSWARRAVSRGGSLYARAVLNLPIKDCTGGFKCLRRSAINRLDLDHLLSNGYAFQVEVNYACHQAGLRFAEIPITFPERVAGRSKMSIQIAAEAAALVLRLRLGLARPAVLQGALSREISP